MAAAVFATIFFGVIAFFFTVLSNFWCQYALSTLTVTNVNQGNSSDFSVAHGIWNYRYSTLYYTPDTSTSTTTVYQYYGCAGYGDEVSADSKWNSAKAFTIIATVLGGIGVIVSSTAICIPKLWKLVSPLFFIATISQGLTFLFFQSNGCVDAPPVETQGTSGVYDLQFSQCGLGSAAILGIVAACLWFISALAAVMAAKKAKAEPAEEGEVAEKVDEGEVAEKVEQAQEVEAN